MPLTIPNYPDATYPAQAEPDKVDFDIIASATQGDGVMSGLLVTQDTGSNMNVAVAAGTALVNGAGAVLSASTTVALTADATNPRFTIITISPTGAVAATVGTASSAPVFPAISGNVTALAAVFIPANATAIVNNMIIDKRMFQDTTRLPSIRTFKRMNFR